jgi:hypothetical protein
MVVREGIGRKKMPLVAEGRHRQSEEARWKRRRLSGEGCVHRDRGGSMGGGCVIRCGHEMDGCDGRDEMRTQE